MISILYLKDKGYSTYSNAKGKNSLLLKVKEMKGRKKLTELTCKVWETQTVRSTN